MNISAIQSPSSAANVAALQELRSDRAALGESAPKPVNPSRDPEAIKKASAQFEAIIMRQLLAPSIEPIMSGGLGGDKGAGAGGSIYGYMLTDTLANSLAQAGGLGLGRMLERQLSPRSHSAEHTGSAPLPVHPSLLPYKTP